MQQLEIVARLAATHGVIPDIHPDDHMFTYMRDNLNMTLEQAVNSYFVHGAESFEHLRSLVTQYRATQKLSLLEFASGYGCVTRFIATRSPEWATTCCDIHPAAVKFINDYLSVPAIQSVPVPEDLKLPDSYDVVFALSLFSHLPAKIWFRWLRALSDCVKPGGLLIFTTHGMVSARIQKFPPLDSDGYWFHPFSEQKDLDSADYGTTITTFDFVLRQVKALPSFRLLNFQEGLWRKNQDVYVLERSGL
jgi:SAM-dependent methyltransferase